MPPAPPLAPRRKPLRGSPILIGGSAEVNDLWHIQWRAFRPANPTETLGLGQTPTDDLKKGMERIARTALRALRAVDLSLTPDQAAAVAVLMVVREVPSLTPSDDEPLKPESHPPTTKR